MKKKILASVVAISIAASSLYAYSDRGFKDCDKKSKHSQKKEYMLHHKKSGFPIVMHALSQLELPKKQWTQIKLAILDMKKQNLQNSSTKGIKEYFDKDGFDTNGYIKERSAFMQKKLENEAQAIEKITSILDATQLQNLQEVMGTPAMHFNKRDK